MLILDDIKTLTGTQASNIGFDAELLLIINSAASELAQLGVNLLSNGPISSETAWPTFDNEIIGALTKQLLGLKVKIMFDPAPSETIMKSFQNSNVMLEGRLAHEVEEVANV